MKTGRNQTTDEMETPIQRNTQPMLWIQEGPCGTCGLSPGPKGGRDMHTHSLAVAADTQQESSAATGSSILAAGEIPCQLPAR